MCVCVCVCVGVGGGEEGGKGGVYTPHEILPSIFGMYLKLELLLALDRRRQ